MNAKIAKLVLMVCTLATAFALFATVAIAQTDEDPNKAAEKPIKLDLKDVRLRTAVDTLFKGLNLNYIIEQGVPDTYITPVSFNQPVPFRTALKTLLAAQNLEYVEEDGIFKIRVKRAVAYPGYGTTTGAFPGVGTLGITTTTGTGTTVATTAVTTKEKRITMIQLQHTDPYELVMDLSGGGGGYGGGYGNSGYGNSGYGNSGYGNSGYGNSGYGNSGYGNSGYGNSGYGNSGYGGSSRNSSRGSSRSSRGSSRNSGGYSNYGY